MRKFAIIAATCAALAACTEIPRQETSCAEWARRQAARQLEDENAILDEQESGARQKSELRRQFNRLDAEAYRAKLYEDCLRKRGGPAPEGR